MATAEAAGPMPVGSSTTTVSYTTTSGLESFSESVNYLGQNITDAVAVGQAPNIWSFNSVNSFGRRTFLANSGFPDVLDTGTESLITHAFFKGTNSSDYFPDITADSNVTIDVGEITFDQPVFVEESTVMLHALWRADQADLIENPFIQHLHNHHTQANSFRDFDDFIADDNVFSDVPTNYVLGDISPVFSGNGTNVLSVSFEMPYSILRHLEDVGQDIPSGLPAPHGFLEPFHFHLEYTVTPEPTTLMLLAVGALTLHRRRGRVLVRSAR